MGRESLGHYLTEDVIEILYKGIKAKVVMGMHPSSWAEAEAKATFLRGLGTLKPQDLTAPWGFFFFFILIFIFIYPSTKRISAPLWSREAKKALKEVKDVIPVLRFELLNPTQIWFTPEVILCYTVRNWYSILLYFMHVLLSLSSKGSIKGTYIYKCYQYIMTPFFKISILIW